MRKLITTTAAAVTIGAGILAATLPASASVSWKAQTCAAFHAYQAHPAGGELVTVVVDSTHLPRGYLKADVGHLYADASSPSAKAAKYAAKDRAYIAQDCA